MAEKTLLEIVDEHSKSVEELQQEALRMSANVDVILDELERLRTENSQLVAINAELSLQNDNMRFWIRTKTSAVVN